MVLAKLFYDYTDFCYINFQCEVLQEGTEEKQKDYGQQDSMNQCNHIIFVPW